MKKLIGDVLLCLLLGLPLTLLAQTFPPIAVSGPEIPGNNYDDDGDGVTDEIPATSIVVDANAAGNYHWHFRNCEKVTYANVADATFPDAFRVEKPAGSTIIEGEIVCYIPNLPAATYTMHVQYSTPGGTQAIWPGVNKSLRYQMKPEEASILPFTTTPQWQALVYTGTAANYYAGQNGGDLISFVWPGGSFAIAFKSDVVRLACGYLSIGAEPVRTCPGETGTPLLADYELYELGKVAAVPTAYNSAAFDNAKVMSFTGTESGSVCGGTLTVKGLWQNTTTDRQFWSIVCNDTDAVVVNKANDYAPGAAEDQFDFRHRANLSAVLDTDTYMLVGNLHPVYSDADWSGTNNARNFATSLNTTIVRNINSGVSWNMFIAADLGSNVAPDTFGLCQAILIDRDTDLSTSTKYFKGSSTGMAEWGVCKWLSTAVPVSADKTAPVVTSPAIPSGSVEQTSFIVTANTNEDGVCRVRYGTSSGVYGSLTPGTPSVNGICTVSVTGLTAGQTYYADMQVCDAALNCGDSTEVSQKTSLPAVAGCTHYASPAGSGDGTTELKPYRISNFLAQASPGQVLCLLDGTYTGTTGMIVPGASRKGNKLAPITVKAINDGAVLIDGQNANRPVSLINDNDWWIIEGINARASPVAVVTIAGGSSDNIIRRVCAWDTRETVNDHVWRISSTSSAVATNNLLEDVCGFGSGRKIFSIAQGNNVPNNTIRRAWAAFTKHTGADADGDGPNNTYNIAYSGGNGHRLENVVGTWNLAVATDAPSGCCRNIIGVSDEGTGHQILGSMVYLRSGEPRNPFQLIQRSNNPGILMKDIVLYTEPATVNPYNVTNAPCTSCFITNSTEIGGSASNIGATTTVTNREDYANLDAMNDDGGNPFQTTAGNGARMCFRYVDGQLTSTKLWPWPMDQRINDALTADGRNPNDYFGTGNTFTQWVESVFGAIPSGCKS